MKKITGIINIAAALLTALIFTGTAAYSEASAPSQPAAAYTELSERRTVVPCGTPFGIKMLTDGVVVTDFGAVNGRFSQQSPAEAAGLRKGDIIRSVNGIDITDSLSVSEAVQEDPVCTINVIRDGEELTFTANALTSDADGQYKLSLYDTTEEDQLRFAEDYNQDGNVEEVQYSSHWSWIYSLNNNPQAADGTHIVNWAAGFVND